MIKDRAHKHHVTLDVNWSHKTLVGSRETFIEYNRVLFLLQERLSEIHNFLNSRPRDTWAAASHYLNQCWNIVNWMHGNKLQLNLNRNSYIFIQVNTFEMSFGKWGLFCLSLNVLLLFEHGCRVLKYCQCMYECK